MPKVGHLSPVKCPPSPAPRRTANTSRISVSHSDLHFRIPLQLSVGLNQGGKWPGGASDWGQVMGDIWPGVNDLPLAWRNGRASDSSDRAALLLMSL